MSRNALRRYLYGLVVASLPGCCHDVAATGYTVDVDAAAFDDADGGANGFKVCANICRQNECSGYTLDGGTAKVHCVEVGGRSCGFPVAGGPAPLRLRPVAIFCDDPVGAWFARMAHVEGAAVYGFLQLAGELQRLGAPAELVDAAHEAAGDERRHARIARRLAREARATVPAVEIDPTPPRDAFQVALGNAVDGGVFETFGVLVTHWQSRTAAGRRVRAAFCRIHEDELRHAELARAVARWLEPRLTPPERARIAEARRAAAARLRRDLEAPVPERLVKLAGLPPPEVTRRWAARMTADLWS
jgi:hypothetical protein